MDNVIELEHVSKKYGDFYAVQDVHFEVRAGEIFGFLGINGAGKTTTLRMLAGVLLPSEGKIRIAGINLLEEPEKAKALTGYIPDRPYLYAKLTALEFLRFIADLYEVPTKIAEERIEELLLQYGLGDWRDEMIESFSHGMRQRLATAAAMIHHPKVLIIDEPMVGLDPHGAKLLKESLRQYAKEGMGILLSTHSLHVAEEVADRLAIIHHGKILHIGTFQELKQAAGSTHDRLEQVFLQLTSEEARPWRGRDDSRAL